MLGPLKDGGSCWGEQSGSFKEKFRANTMFLCEVPVYDNKCSNKHPMNSELVEVLGEVLFACAVLMVLRVCVK